MILKRLKLFLISGFVKMIFVALFCNQLKHNLKSKRAHVMSWHR